MATLSFLGRAQDYFIKLLQEGELHTLNLLEKTSVDFFPLPSDIFVLGIFINSDNCVIFIVEKHIFEHFEHIEMDNLTKYRNIYSQSKSLGKPIAYISIEFSDEDFPVITSINVDEGLQGRQVATYLILLASSYLREKGIYTISLDDMSDNYRLGPSSNLYEGLGCIYLNSDEPTMNCSTDIIISNWARYQEKIRIIREKTLNKKRSVETVSDGSIYTRTRYKTSLIPKKGKYGGRKSNKKLSKNKNTKRKKNKTSKTMNRNK
jgi:hypothetical protein